MENRKLPAAGEFYRHFKGNLYQIVGIAKHSETMEQMVIYQALYGDYGMYVRPLEMFLSPVDKEKYPEVSQVYRFEKCVPGAEEAKSASVSQPVRKESDAEVVFIEPQKETAKENSEEEAVRPEILRFLDAEGAEARLKVLRELRMDLDESLMTTIELSLDLLPNDNESLERRYDFVERTLEQRIRFEGSRLR